MSALFLVLPIIIEIHVFNVNSVDPGQMLHLIWLYTVCQDPFSGMLGINALGLKYNMTFTIILLLSHDMTEA